MIDPKTNSYIPATPIGRSKDNTNDAILPPICISTRTEFKYAEVTNNEQLIERLKTQQLKFMIQRNFYILVKIIKCKCECPLNEIQFVYFVFDFCFISDVLYQQSGYKFYNARIAFSGPRRNCYFT